MFKAEVMTSAEGKKGVSFGTLNTYEVILIKKSTFKRYKLISGTTDLQKKPFWPLK